jgi:hypothetical protein
MSLAKPFPIKLPTSYNSLQFSCMLVSSSSMHYSLPYLSDQMMSWAGDMATSLNMAPAYSIPPSAPFLTSPAKTSLEENAAKAQQMLVEFQQQVAQPQRRKDMNIEFPPGLFPSEQEIDLEGSQQAYQILQAGLDDPSQFMNLFTQLEADPFRQQHMLGDIDLLD